MDIIKLRTGLYRTNTYLIIDNGEAVAVDPGAEPDKIADEIKNRGAVLKHILLTHAHFDHVGAVAALKKWSGATVYMSKIDLELYDEICTIGESMFVEPFDVDVGLNDGDALSLIGHEFRVVGTPGHTPGSLCFVLDGKTMFTGDTLFKLHVGRTDFIGGDRRAQIASLAKLFAFPDDCEVLPGHEGPTTLFFERDNNPYAR